MKTKILVFLTIYIMVTTAGASIVDTPEQDYDIGSNVYVPTFEAYNIKEQMVLQPIFTPDNGLSTHVGWINQAENTIDIQAQYIKKIDDISDSTWVTGENPMVDALVDAAENRNVDIRVQVREDSDSDDIAAYFANFNNIEVRYMGSSGSATEDGWLSATHNKLMIIDNEVILVSSINFGVAFTNSREAGMVIQNANAAAHFTEIFESDWADGELPTTLPMALASTPSTGAVQPYRDFDSHTDIPRTNFTGEYNLTLYTNPDNADEVIFKYLEAARESIYVSMYTISRQDFVDVLVEHKKNNPSMDIQVLISERRVGGSENVDTRAAADELVANNIPVYNASVDFFENRAGFYHNKYWIIDDQHTFVYSGNWSPRSTTPQLEAGDDSYSSGDPNRDMGVVIAEASDVADFFKDVWDQDVAIASAFELPIGVSITSQENGDFVSGSFTVTASINGLTNPSYTVTVGTETVTGSGLSISESFDATNIPQGVQDITVSVNADEGVFSDVVTVNVINAGDGSNQFLITEILPNPDLIDDDEGEFIEVTNNYPVDIFIEGYTLDIDGDETYTFGNDFVMPAESTYLFARSSTEFENAYGVAVDVELSFALTNSGGYATLYDNRGEVLDSVAYGSGSSDDGSPAYAAPDAGESLQRIPVNVDTNSDGDFVAATPTPGAFNSEIQDNGGGQTVDDIVSAPAAVFAVFSIGVLTYIIKKRQI